MSTPMSYLLPLRIDWVFFGFPPSWDFLFDFFPLSLGDGRPRDGRQAEESIDRPTEGPNDASEGTLSEATEGRLCDDLEG